MAAIDDQFRELARVFPGARAATESGVTYYLLPSVTLPAHCQPATLDLLLCPVHRDGYETRLFLPQQVQRPPHPDEKKRLNWNGHARILERNWHALSWQIPGALNMRLVQMVLCHLEAFQ